MYFQPLSMPEINQDNTLTYIPVLQMDDTYLQVDIECHLFLIDKCRYYVFLVVYISRFPIQHRYDLKFCPQYFLPIL